MDVDNDNLGSRRESLNSATELNAHLRGVKVGKQIGAGAFGAVFRGSWKGTRVAIKQVSSGNVSELEAELDVLRQLNHPCIVRFYGLTENCGSPGIVMELCSNGSLDTALVSNEFPPSELTRMCAQMARGLEYLADQGVLHRDLAGMQLIPQPRYCQSSHLCVLARNVLLDSENNCKLTDVREGNSVVFCVSPHPTCNSVQRFSGILAYTFLYFGLQNSSGQFGLARVMEGNASVYQVHSAVAVRWAAPEVLAEQAASPASDVYSLGVTMWECFSRGDVPFGDQDTNSGVTISVMKGKRPPRPATANDALWAVIEASWVEDSEARPSAEDIAESLEAILDAPDQRAASQKKIYGKTPAIVGERRTDEAHYTGIAEDMVSSVPAHYTGIAEDTTAAHHSDTVERTEEWSDSSSFTDSSSDWEP
jgi:serine/threonine protein kinase